MSGFSGTAGRVLALPSARPALAAGAGSDARLAALVILALLIAAGLYLGSCLIWPYAPCLACAIEGLSSGRGGRGRNPGSRHGRYGRCPACGGSGERLRIGTRLIRSARGGRWP